MYIRFPVKSYFYIEIVFVLIGLLVPAEANMDVSYTYDAIGRVMTAAYDNGLCVAYSYDAAGNRVSQTAALGGAPSALAWGSSTWGCNLWTAQ